MSDSKTAACLITRGDWRVQVHTTADSPEAESLLEQAIEKARAQQRDFRRSWAVLSGIGVLSAAAQAAAHAAGIEEIRIILPRQAPAPQPKKEY